MTPKNPETIDSLLVDDDARNLDSLEAILVEEADPYVNALGIKGVGEIGITGTAGAIANAVWHATGVRVRRFPITIDQLIVTQAA